MKSKLVYQNNKIAIMGGTFDPIHIGHLVIAQEAIEYKNLDKVIFIPAGVPPHKKKVVTIGRKRLEMTKLAIKDNEKFGISDFEIYKKSKSYSVETVEYLKKLYNVNDIYFIMGEDSLLSIETWFKYEEFLSKTKILVVGRTFEKEKILNNKIEKLMEKNYSVEKIPVNYLNISSTNIRDAFRNKKNPRYYLKDNVYEYIKMEGLYE